MTPEFPTSTNSHPAAETPGRSKDKNDRREARLFIVEGVQNTNDGEA
jgi:hypothetical protein